MLHDKVPFLDRIAPHGEILNAAGRILTTRPSIKRNKFAKRKRRGECPIRFREKPLNVFEPLQRFEWLEPLVEPFTEALVLFENRSPRT
jgi:hypothetical protein